MAVEATRGCGYRKVGGLYLCGGGISRACDRLPYKIENCPTCGGGLKFTRGWTWLDWLKYAGVHEGQQVEMQSQGVAYTGRVSCSCPAVCPTCWPLNQPQPYGLLWVGEKSYSPEAFVRESLQMGISRRIPFTGSIPRIPKLLKLGETWVLFAHKHVIKTGKDVNGKDIFEPAIFHAFKPSSLELLVWEKDATKERLEELQDAGVTVVIIPNGDKDHDPDTPTGLPKAEKEELESKMLFTDLRQRLKK